MWLKKAEEAAKRDNNDELLYHIYLALGNYFEYRKPTNSADYYKLAYENKEREKEAIQKYGRCLYWGWLGVKKDKEKALEIGYNLEDEDKEFIQQREEEEEEEEEEMREAYYEEEEQQRKFTESDINYEEDLAFLKEDFEKVKKLIIAWNTNFEDIDHPYQKVLERFPSFLFDDCTLST